MAIRFTCAGCGRDVKAPDQAAGKRAKCPGCGGVQIVPPPAAIEAPIAAAQVIAPPPQPAAGPTCPECHAELFDGASICPRCGWVNPVGTRRAIPSPAVVPPSRSFMRDVLKSFTFHFAGRGPWMLGMTVILVTAAPFVARFGIGGLLLGLAIEGLYCAMLLSIVLDTCAGEDELPSLDAGDANGVGIFKALGLFIAGTLFVLWPFAGWLVLMEVSSSSLLASPLLGMALVILGVLLWPMTMLTIAVNGFSLEHLRYDRQLATIARAPGAYLCICAALGAVVGMAYGASLLAQGLLPGGRGVGSILARAIALLFVGSVCQVYFSFASMRIIGLFYRHYKARFAWLAE